MQHIYIVLKRGKWKLAVKSQYDEILHNKIYLRIKKSKKRWFLFLLTLLKTADIYGSAYLKYRDMCPQYRMIPAGGDEIILCPTSELS